MTAQLALPLGRARRDAGEADARGRVSPYAKDALRDEILWQANHYQQFTAASVVGALPETVRSCFELHPNAIGAVFTELARAGVIRDTGRVVASGKPNARGRKITIWTGAAK